MGVPRVKRPGPVVVVVVPWVVVVWVVRGARVGVVGRRWRGRLVRRVGGRERLEGLVEQVVAEHVRRIVREVVRVRPVVPSTGRRRGRGGGGAVRVAVEVRVAARALGLQQARLDLGGVRRRPGVLAAAPVPAAPAAVVVVVVVQVVAAAVQRRVVQVVLLHVGLDDLQQLVPLQGRGAPPRLPPAVAAARGGLTGLAAVLRLAIVSGRVLLRLRGGVGAGAGVAAAPAALRSHRELDPDGAGAAGR